MAPLRYALTALSLSLAVPVHAQSVARWQPFVTEASLRFGVPETWIERVIQAESAGATMQDGHPIRSRVGAIGLMQLMPDTWAFVRAVLGLGTDPDDPHDNILAGTFYLRLMYDRFGYPGLFGAYNAGPARYGAHLATGATLPGETVTYLQRVAGAAMPSGAPKPQGRLFVARSGPGVEATTAAQDRLTPGLFAVNHNVP